MSAVLERFVAAAAGIGLNYGFLIEPYERTPFLRGALVTIELTLAAGLLSLMVGAALGLMLTARSTVLRRPARVFVEVMRNTPTLVQLYCAFLVLNLLIAEALKGAANPFSAFAWVVIVIGFHVGAFNGEALRAGLEAVPAPMLEAARALGLGRRAVLARIELPLAARFALPSLVNNLIELAKMTVIASAIAVNDITYEAIMIWTQRDNVLELMSVILLFFWALTFLIGRAGRLVEGFLRMPGYGH